MKKMLIEMKKMLIEMKKMLIVMKKMLSQIFINVKNVIKYIKHKNF